MSRKRFETDLNVVLEGRLVAVGQIENFVADRTSLAPLHVSLHVKLKSRNFTRL
jgi:hypothetical protein